MAAPRASLAIALTGGIASGKSATSQRFVQHGTPVFDADVVAHELVAPRHPALAEISTAFGAQMLTVSGELDRARLRDCVFADAAARARLESILHPRIRTILCERVRTCTAPYCVLAIPLFAECHSDYAWVDRVLVTDAPRAVQLRRLTQRSGIDATTAQRMLDVQASRAQRLALADDVIDNTGPLAALDAAVARLHARYSSAAAART
ncbi:MAG: dephospho-CoA kinase [Rudaea sp.]